MNFNVILYPILTERSFDLVEGKNTLVFAVDRRATKLDIKEDVEKKYKVKVARVNVLNTFSKEKKAFVKLKPDFDAGKIISDLGLM